MAYLVLENGAVFEGERIGATRDTVGELVFTTGVVGYLEALTDPAYAGQTVMQTFPVVGNYGVMEEDLLGEPVLHGYVVRELCDTPSNFRSQYELSRFLKEKNIPGIAGVDTREITRILREEGTMNALICDAVPSDLSDLRSYRVSGKVAEVGIREKALVPAVGEAAHRVALLDFGGGKQLAAALSARGCEVILYPHTAKAEDILADSPDGIALSGGPGDPTEQAAAIAEIKKLAGTCPLLGVGLGHQLLAQAMGGKTLKLPHGHHGNQPVKGTTGHRVFITPQNHGYAVVAESVKSAEVTLFNVNDGSCEGLRYTAFPALSLQFLPTGETATVYDEFLTLMGGETNA